MDIWCILTIAFSLMMAFSIGANDASNGLGTSYGTQAIPMWAIIINGALSEFVGSMFCSDKVAATLASNIITEIKCNQESTTVSIGNEQRMMFTVCLVSFTFIMAASFTGMPISGTHTVVGALIGAGLIGSNTTDDIGWDKLWQILISWFFSPVFSLVLSCCLMVLVSAFTMNTQKLSYRFRILSMQIIAGVCTSSLSYIFDQLFNKHIQLNVTDFCAADDKYHNNFGLSNAAYFTVLLLIGFLLGNIIARLIIFLHLICKQNGGNLSAKDFFLYLFLTILIPVWTSHLEFLTLNVALNHQSSGNSDFVEKETGHIDCQKLKLSLNSLKRLTFFGNDTDPTVNAHQIDFNENIDYKSQNCNFDMYIQKFEQKNYSLLKLNATQTDDNNQGQDEIKQLLNKNLLINVYTFKQAMITSQLFRCLMVASDFLVCMSHGSNDVGNAISPLLVLMKINGQETWISYMIGATGIALGLIIYGERVMKCIGEDLIHLDYFKGFCSQFATAICVCLGSHLGIPLSTTHCIVGALAGVFIAGKFSFMKKVYYRQNLDQRADGVKDESSKMNFKTLKKIFFWWSITVPTAMGFAALICYILIKTE